MKTNLEIISICHRVHDIVLLYMVVARVARICLTLALIHRVTACNVFNRELGYNHFAIIALSKDVLESNELTYMIKSLPINAVFVFQTR